MMKKDRKNQSFLRIPDALRRAVPYKQASAPPEDAKKSPSGYYMPPGDWFHTFMMMNIPIAGWIYLYRLAYSREENQLRDFAQAYLCYKLVFLIIGLLFLILFLFAGAIILDKLLAYMQML